MAFDIERALSTLNTSTGAYLIPEAIDPIIRDYVYRETPLLNVVSRKPWPTQTYVVRRRTGVPTSAWAADGASLPSASNSAYTKDTFTVKFLYTRGEVTGPMIAAAGGVVNALQEEIRVSSREIARQLTADMVAADGSPSTEILGMLSQVPAGTPGDQGGTLDNSGSQLKLAYLDEAIDATLGEGNVILCGRKVRRKINSLLQAQQRFNDTIDVGAGFRVPSYDGIPIITDLNWETNTDILIFNREDAKLLVNQDFTYSPLAKTKDSEDYFIKGYFGFALEGRPVRLKIQDPTFS
jgi:hypothetical protein